MRTKLLSLLFLVSISGYSQSPINSFYGFENAIYTTYTSPMPLDQSASGADLTWDFSGLTAAGVLSANLIPPTAEELITFPNTTTNTSVDTFVGGNLTGHTNIYTAASGTEGNTVSMTGISATELVINYSSNNATIGTYPMVYGYTNSDNCAGTYVYGEYSGTFSGTIETIVDAYGTLTADMLPAIPATRMKTTQTLFMNYSFFTNVGTFTQTIYSYYNENTNLATEPLFRTTTTTISVPMLAIDETMTTIDMFAGSLSTVEPAVSNNIQIAPNPANDFLQIQTPNGIEIRKVNICDISGKSIAIQNGNGNILNISNLAKGIYFAEITTDIGKVTKKIIKN